MGCLGSRTVVIKLRNFWTREMSVLPWQPFCVWLYDDLYRTTGRRTVDLYDEQQNKIQANLSHMALWTNLIWIRCS